MKNSIQLRLLDYISKKNKNIDSAFTLVELIVVIVIIGILSSIAIPSFRNASDKARQKEASTLVSTYVKATQAHATEYGLNPADAGQLSEYIQITACACIAHRTPPQQRLATMLSSMNRRESIPKQRQWR